MPNVLRWASARLCGVQQRAPPIFGSAATTLAFGPYSSLLLIVDLICCRYNLIHRIPVSTMRSDKYVTLCSLFIFSLLILSVVWWPLLRRWLLLLVSNSTCLSHRNGIHLPMTVVYWMTVKTKVVLTLDSGWLSKTVHPTLSEHYLSCLSCPVCYVGVLWPNGWMD